LPVPAAKITTLPLFEVPDRLSADVGFRDVLDRDRGLDASRDVHLLERGLKREGVDDHREHSHVVGRRAVDAVLGDRRAAHEVAAADHDRHFSRKRLNFADLLGEVLDVLRRNAELPLAKKRLAGKLEQHPAVFRGAALRHPGEV
jgi:hypothetical protein